MEKDPGAEASMENYTEFDFSAKIRQGEFLCVDIMGIKHYFGAETDPEWIINTQWPDIIASSDDPKIEREERLKSITTVSGIGIAQTGEWLVFETEHGRPIDDRAGILDRIFIEARSARN